MLTKKEIIVLSEAIEVLQSNASLPYIGKACDEAIVGIINVIVLAKEGERVFLEEYTKDEVLALEEAAAENAREELDWIMKEESA